MATKAQLLEKAIKLRKKGDAAFLDLGAVMFQLMRVMKCGVAPVATLVGLKPGKARALVNVHENVVMGNYVSRDDMLDIGWARLRLISLRLNGGPNDKLLIKLAKTKKYIELQKLLQGKDDSVTSVAFTIPKSFVPKLKKALVLHGALYGWKQGLLRSEAFVKIMTVASEKVLAK